MMVIMPASAHTLDKLARGACSDLLSATASAMRGPVVLVPAMNDLMWTNPGVARNVAQLRADGYYVVSPGNGIEVASGAEEDGAIAVTSDIGLGGGGIAPEHLPPMLQALLAFHRDELAPA